MKRIVISFVSPLICALLMVSCLGNDDEIAKSSDVALLSFGIKDLKKTIKDTDGTDSTYTIVVSGSSVKFTIDQANQRVYNVDSIDYGTDVSHVLVNVKADGSVVYRKPDGEYSSVGDSIDFTNPVEFRVTSYDGNFARSYMVYLNVHKVDPRETVWRRVMDANFPKDLFVQQKALVKGDSLYVIGIDDKGAYYVSSTALDDGINWTTDSCVGIEGAGFSVLLEGEAFYLNTDSGLYRSDNAIMWAIVEGAEVSTLLAVEKDVMWAMADGGFVSSSDMESWNVIGQQPKKSIANSIVSFCQPLRTNKDIMSTVFIAQSEEVDTCAQVWIKLTTEDKWREELPQGDNVYGCPNLKNLSVIQYANKMYAFGGESLGERQVKLEAFSACYESCDNGVTWKVNEEAFSLSEEFKEEDGTFSVATIGEYVWVMWSSGKVWRGRWNGIQSQK